jgi:hypothetical protein
MPTPDRCCTYVDCTQEAGASGLCPDHADPMSTALAQSCRHLGRDGYAHDYDALSGLGDCGIRLLGRAGTGVEVCPRCCPAPYGAGRWFVGNAIPEWGVELEPRTSPAPSRAVMFVVDLGLAVAALLVILGLWVVAGVM